MTISLSDAGKRFNREWIFRHLSYCFESGGSYAITGPNGSGKSTLLQTLAGAVSVSEGKMEWLNEGKAISPETIHRHISICAPYLEVIEEMTLREFLQFHAGFKPLLPQTDIKSIAQTMGLEKAIDKQIRHYSSGMKQRVKLAQAIFSNTPILLLDEPCTNLDISGVTLYQNLMEQYAAHRLVIISSNEANEYLFCKEKLNIADFKGSC